MLSAVAVYGADPAVIRGVYSDHSTTLQVAKHVGYDVRAAVVRRVDSIARLNVNVVWWTNLPNDADMIAHVVRTCRARGIECVCGSGWWYAGPSPVEGQWANLQALHNALPADARPWKWSLGDETRIEWLTELRTLADRCQAAGIPATMVQVPEFHQQTLTTLGTRLPMMAVDVYPVFQPGLGPVDGIAWGKMEHAAVIRRSRTTGVQPLLMTQGFGGDATFALPTPARTRWQVWSAVAAGSPGAVVFAAGMPSPDGGTTPPMASLVDWQGTAEMLTPAGDAIAKTFSRLQSVETLLQGSTTETGPTITTPAAGDVSTFVRTASGRRLLIVVADPDQPQRTLKMTLPGVSGVTPLASSTGGAFTALPWPWYLIWPGTMSVTVPAGEAWIGELR